MWGLIIGVALGGLLVLTAITALRQGELSLGELRLVRGELRFGLVVGVLGALGLLSLGSAMMLASETEDAAPMSVQVGDFALSIPGDWSPAAGPPTAAPTEAFGTAAFSGPGGELMVVWRHMETAEEGAIARLVADLKQPDIAYDRWDEREVDGGRMVEMGYASPRGRVRGRALARRQAGGLSWAVVTCSHDGSSKRCETSIASLRSR
jgi:hypothetical protein